MSYPISYDLVPPNEIFHRTSRLQQALAASSLSGTMILDGVNMFYYTGTIQNGILFVPAEGEPALFILAAFLKEPF